MPSLMSEYCRPLGVVFIFISLFFSAPGAGVDFSSSAAAGATTRAATSTAGSHRGIRFIVCFLSRFGCGLATLRSARVYRKTSGSPRVRDARMRVAAVRAGLLAIGAIYVAMGYVSARIAFAGARDPVNGVPGALRFLLDRSHGAWLLGAVVAGLAGIAVAYAARAVRGPGRALRRVGLAANAVGYAALAVASARLLLHAGRRAGGARLEREGVSWLLTESWGAFVLELVGVGVVAGGLWEIGRGFRGPLRLQGGALPRPLRRALAAVSRFGLVARGVTLAALGYFLIRAAEELDPALVRTLGGTLDALARTAFGPAFLAVVSAGLASYGVYLWARALGSARTF